MRVNETHFAVTPTGSWMMGIGLLQTFHPYRVGAGRWLFFVLRAVQGLRF